LVRTLKDVSFTDAVSLLYNVVGNTEITASLSLLDISTINCIESNEEFCSKFTAEEYYDEECLKNLVKPKYTLSRGFTEQSIKDFEIGCCLSVDSRFLNYDVLPVRDSDGSLVAFTNRNTDLNCDKKDRWKHEGRMHKYLYGINLSKKYINETRTVIIVEGPYKMIRLWEAGLKNCVAIFGTDLSEEQYNILLNSGAFTIIIATDRDEAGKKARTRIRSKINRFFYVSDLEFPFDDIDKVDKVVLKDFLRGTICQEFLELELQELAKLAEPLKAS
jgi:hypothetical protein